jgi:uncharacterized membrane protein
MSARAWLIILLAVAVWTASAQVVVEEEDAVVTDVVDILDIKVDNSRSVTAAMAMSFAVPGAGHYYIGKPGSAFAYMAIDAASIFGALMFYSFAGQRENEARSFAAAAAGIEKAPSGEAYWRHVGAFMDAAAYNEAVELSRGEESGQYLETETWWRWGDESQKDEYNGIRQKARDLRVASSFFVGALVANRIVSAVDLRVFGKRSMSSGVRLGASVAPGAGGASLALRADF